MAYVKYNWFIIGFLYCLCEMEHNEQSNKERSYNWNLNKFLLYVYMSDVISNFIDVEVPIWANFFLYCIVQYNCKTYVSFILWWHTYTSLTSLPQSIKCLFIWKVPFNLHKYHWALLSWNLWYFYFNELIFSSWTKTVRRNWS